MAKRAVKISTANARFPAVCLITKERIVSLENYSRFIIKELLSKVKTTHVLIAQWDGYVLNDEAWQNEWLDYDYIGAIWTDGIVGNGGFSLRSRRLLEALQDERFEGPFYPEDEKICRDWRLILETEYGMKFAPPEVASAFSIENGRYTGQFGFHSFLTKLPSKSDRPLVFKHSGDAGDIIYGLAAVKALGGGVFYIAPSQWETRIKPTIESARNILGFIQKQDYIWNAAFTDHGLSHADYDMNSFREYFVNGDKAKDESLLNMQLRACKTDWPSDKPWLTVDFPVQVPGRPIIISRSERYRTDRFPWGELVHRHAGEMIFLGTAKEHEQFVCEFGFVPRIETPTLLDVARVISGGRVFIGNQSCPMAIACGLGKNLIQEVCDLDANCIIPRNNSIYNRGEKVKIPKDWL